MSTPSKKTKRTASSQEEIEEKDKRPKVDDEISVYYVDTCGSFLRPDTVLQARADKESGKIKAADLNAIEDVAIKELVEKQIEDGFKVVVDGEFRREMYWLDFWTGFDKIRIGHDFPTPAEPAIVPSNIRNFINRVNTPYAFGKLEFNPEHPELKAFEFLKSVTPAGVIPKVIIPSPTFLHIFRPAGDLFPSEYGSIEEFYADIGTVYKESILAFYKLGARIVQIDEPTWFIFPMYKENTTEARITKLKEYVDVTVKIIKPILSELPPDLKLGYHLCRGNGDGIKYAVPYSYVDVLPALVELNPAFLLLEYEDERSGPLSDLKGYGEQLAPKGTQIFLGLVSTKTKTVETVAELEAKVQEAAKYYPLEKLGVCNQCGFSTAVGGINDIDIPAQWAKVKLLGELQKKIWGV